VALAVCIVPAGYRSAPRTGLMWIKPGRVQARNLWVSNAPKEFIMYRRILVATDGSALSKKAVKSAVDLAALCGAELVAVKAVPRYPKSYFEGSLPLAATEISRIEKQWTDEAQAVLDAVVTAAAKQGVTARAVTVKSDLVGEALIAAARKHKCDVLVMASHGRRGLKRLLLGSETQHVLTHSHIPVLVLR
jgi:nucleotide-binding universal stress UspA family protein